MEEWQLANFLRGQANQLLSGAHELDETTLLATAALLEKTSQPGGHFPMLRELYLATHDFRLLAQVPESMLGRTRHETYEALGSLESSILREIRKEATVDELVAHVRKLRADIEAGVVPRGADPNARSQALDLRALDLVEAVVERKAAEVLNQPGSHARAAVAALQRAFDREWQPGERLQMARFLQDLGSIPVAELSAERERKLRLLYDDSEASSLDRARIGHAYASVLFLDSDRRNEAIDFDEAVLREFASPFGGRVPDEAADLVTGHSYFLRGTNAFAHAEQYVERHRAGAGPDALLTYTEHLNELHTTALHRQGRTSLGEGATLYRNLVRRLIDQCSTPDKNRRHRLLSQLINVYRHACERKFSGSVDELLAFSRTALPELILPLDNEYASIINQVTDVVAEHAGKLPALDLLLKYVEQYPPRFDFEWRTAWSQHGGRLAQLRSEASQLDEQGRANELKPLEARLLKIVLAELRRDLTSGESRDVGIYTLGHSYYWEARRQDFVRTANQILVERPDAPRTHTYVASYLHDRLHEFDRGIEVLFAAHRRGLLDDAGVDQLIDYLHRNRRYAESIALLEAAIDRQPERMDLRTRLMEAYHATKRLEQLAKLIEGTDKDFHQNGRWTEDNICTFARGCSVAGHAGRAAGYFEEAINLRQRTAPNRGIGDGTLSLYYQQLAEAYSTLGKTKLAIDAAAAAIVSWGADQANRLQAFTALKNVMGHARDLDAYVATLDRDAATSGADSPILRKALGLVYQERAEWAKAADQLRNSLELEPGDRETHQALLACLDAQGDEAGAIAAMLAQIDVDRHNLELYSALARRASEDPSLGERAATSLIESAPNEAGHHEALARFRQDQKRWSEAIEHWARVAELGRLEPTGLLGLAEAQLHLQQWDGARETLKQLHARDWPGHFGDVDTRIRDLETRLPRD
jgi:hypothetical protein